MNEQVWSLVQEMQADYEARIAELEAQLAMPSRQGGGMTEQYSHRNGETEAPTQPGTYWFAGRVDGSTFKGTAIAEEYYGELSIWSNSMLGWGRISAETFEGSWWGPIVPPWTEP